MLNAHQFGGAPGEPNPDSFNNDSDYISAHKSWSSAKASGKSYHDPDFATVAKHSKREGKEQAKPLVKQHRQTEQVKAHFTKVAHSLSRGRKGSFKAARAGSPFRGGRRNPFG